MKIRKVCRVCEGGMEAILSLGDLYVSNFISPGEADGLKAPLDLVICQRCHLLQLKHTVPADAMYQNYWYRSGTNQSMRNALADIASKAEHLAHLKEGDATLDIGCNDGTLLAAYRARGIYRIGFDPARNLAVYSEKVADKLIVDFFTDQAFFSDPDLSTRRPKVITSIAMFYDLDDPNKFVSDVKKVLHKDGLWIIQMSYLPLMLKQNEVGNICHEHLEYYSLQSLEYLIRMHEFEVVDAELNDVNGGSLRAYVRGVSADQRSFADETYRALARERVHAIRQEETRMGLGDIKVYREFATWVDRIKRDVVGFITSEVERGKKVYVYGASTKGNTVLQYFGLDKSVITAAAERNPEKWGKLTVGSHIPIVSEEKAREARPDYFLVLPWHFLDEFVAREKDFLLSGGRFIVPMPHFALI